MGEKHLLVKVRGPLPKIATRVLEFATPAGLAVVRIEYRRDGLHFARMSHANEHADATHTLVIQRANDAEIVLRLRESVFFGNVVIDAEHFHIFEGGAAVTLTLADPLAHAGESEVAAGRLTAPMPGKVVAVLVDKGARVVKGTPLVVMEAMKMQHTIAAPFDGTVDEILFGVGEQVAEDAELLRFSASPS